MKSMSSCPILGDQWEALMIKLLVNTVQLSKTVAMSIKTTRFSFWPDAVIKKVQSSVLSISYRFLFHIHNWKNYWEMLQFCPSRFGFYQSAENVH